MRGTNADRLTRVIVDLLEELHKKGDSEFVDALIELDLSFSQMMVLTVLSRQPGPVPINELAERTKLSVASAGRNVDALVTAGLVDRREDPHDRRIKRVSLSEQGLTLHAKHYEAMHDEVAKFVDLLPDEHAQPLLEALEPIVATRTPAREKALR